MSKIVYGKRDTATVVDIRKAPKTYKLYGIKQITQEEIL